MTASTTLTPGQRTALLKLDCDQRTLDFSLSEGHLTLADVSEAISLGLDPNHVTTWIAAGRPLTELADALHASRGVDTPVVAMGLLVGLTTDDLAWFEASGMAETTPGLFDLLLGIRFDPALADRADGAINPRLARLNEQRRRLCLVLLCRHGYNGSAVLALTTALGDVPWIDTLTTLILDGTAVDEAITLGRADEHLEQQRNVTVTRTTAVDTAARAV